MIPQTLYAIGRHPYSFRENKDYAMITGVYMITPNSMLEPRLCYELTYNSDGFVDYVPPESFELGEYEMSTDFKSFNLSE